jgi:hypothetical protein
VLNTVRFNKKGKRMTATLYVGDLEFNANNDGLHKALSILFKKGVADDITIPSWNPGFAFIKLSWAIGTQVKMRDLCISQSAIIQLEVNSNDQDISVSYTAKLTAHPRCRVQPMKATICCAGTGKTSGYGFRY